MTTTLQTKYQPLFVMQNIKKNYATTIGDEELKDALIKKN